MFYIIVPNYSAVVEICTGTCNAISHVECFVLSYQYLKNVCSAHCGCCLWFLDAKLSCVLLMYFLNQFEMFPVAPSITLITFIIIISSIIIIIQCRV